MRRQTGTATGPCIRARAVVQRSDWKSVLWLRVDVTNRRRPGCHASRGLRRDVRFRFAPSIVDIIGRALVECVALEWYNSVVFGCRLSLQERVRSAIERVAEHLVVAASLMRSSLLVPFLTKVATHCD
jgi:hypothetical protein